MKLFKTIAAAVLLVLGTTVMAQGPGQGNRQMRSSSERAKSDTEQLVKALELTPDQTAKILDINLKSAVKDSLRFAEMRSAGGSMDREAMMKAMQTQREELGNQIKAVLTEAQKTKYDAFLKERELQRAQRQGGQGGMGEGQRPQ
jgi:periplasmic protein CpxP/Spy